MRTVGQFIFLILCGFSGCAHALTATPTQSMNGNYSLTWSYNGSTTLFESVNGGAWASVAVNVSSKNYTGKSAGQYSYYVQQWTQGSQGMVQAGTQGPLTVSVGPIPGTPSSITVPPSSANGTFNVEWSAASGTVQSYKLQRRMNSGAWSTIYTGLNLSRSQTTLSPGQYQYQVQACNISGCSPWQTSTMVVVGDGMVVAPTPSVNGAYTVSWDYTGAMDLYERINGGTWARLIDDFTSGYHEFLGKADGTYSYYVDKLAPGPYGVGMVSTGTLGPVSVTVAVPQPTLTSSTLNSADGHFTLNWSQVAGVGKAALKMVDSTSLDATPIHITTLDSAAGSRSMEVANSGAYRYYIQDRSCAGSQCAAGKQSAPVTVTVDLPDAPLELGGNIAITPADTVGALGYTAGVNAQGDAEINIPLQVVPGVNQLQPQLALRYSSNRYRTIVHEGRNEDPIGSGWSVAGLSEITPCFKQIPDEGATAYGDSPLQSICLDGEPLVRITPAPPEEHDVNEYYADGIEYALWNDRGMKLRRYGLDGDTYFRVFRLDGSIAEYGNTPDSEMRLDGEGVFRTVWRINQLTDAFGNELRYEYHEDYDFKFAVPTKIIYGNNADAVIEFEYEWRNEPDPDDLPPNVNYPLPGGAYQDFLSWYDTHYVMRPASINKIVMRRDGVAVREYRLNSQEDADEWARLRQVQLCGYNAAGSETSCIAPITLEWLLHPSDKLKARVIGVSDGLGRRTEFDYVAMTAGGTEANATEQPFGASPSSPQYTEAVETQGGELQTVVTQMRASDGVGGMRAYEYRYQGRGRNSSKGWGFMGFYAQTIEDLATGIHTYRQYSMDHHFKGATTAEITTLGAYNGALTHYLAKTINRYQSVVLHHGHFLTKWYLQWLENPARTQYVYVSERAQYHYEDNKLLGLSLTRNAPEFTPTSYDRYPVGNPEQVFKYPQLTNTTVQQWAPTVTGLNHSGWGVYSAAQLQSITRSVERIATLDEDRNTHNYLIGFPVTTTTNYYAGDTSGSAQSTHTETAQPYLHSAGHRIPIASTRTVYEGNAALELTTTQQWDAEGHVIAQSVSGVNVAQRSNTASNFSDARSPQTQTNALGHMTQAQYDPRFEQPTQVTDANNRSTQIEYDALGREVEVTTADGVVIQTQHQRCGVGISCPAVDSLTPVAVMTVSSQVSPTTRTYYDSLGRALRTATVSFDGVTQVYQDTHYNALGQVAQTSLPYFAGGTPIYTQYQYDDLGRIVQVTRPDGGVTDTAYSADSLSGERIVTTTQSVRAAGGQSIASKTKSIRTAYTGDVSLTTDAVGTAQTISTAFNYYATGLPHSITVGGQPVASFNYDAAGNRTQLIDADAGTVNSQYTALNQVKQQTDAAGNTIQYSYDLLGRKIQETSADGTANFVYDPINAVGALDYREFIDTRSDYYAKSDVSYNANAQLTGVATTLEVPGLNRQYSQSLAYDGYGRLTQVTYPSGVTVNQQYTAQGYLQKVTDANGVALQTTVAVDALGNLTQESFGNGLTTARHYDPASGRLTGIETGTLQNNDYAWRTDGFLESRTRGTQVETFSYDSLNRLTQADTAINGSFVRSTNTGYALNGNITSKTASTAGDIVNGYAYSAGSAGPHAVTAVTINGVAHTLYYNANGAITHYDAQTGDDKFIGWNARGLPEMITKAASLIDPNPTARDSFAYDGDGQRYYKKSNWRDSNNAQQTEHTFYVGSFEEVITADDPTYARIETTNISGSINHKRRTPHTGSADQGFEYLYRDHLGSIETITDQNGAVITQLGYEPFGSRRKTDGSAQLTPAEIEQLQNQSDTVTRRGYTDHEHLDRTGLIHMNGRIYDPTLGRFLSPDPLVQAPYNSQSYNRYTYTFNNPLLFTDPSGYGSAIKVGQAESQIKAPECAASCGTIQVQITVELPSLSALMQADGAVVIGADGSIVGVGVGGGDCGGSACSGGAVTFTYNGGESSFTSSGTFLNNPSMDGGAYSQGSFIHVSTTSMDRVWRSIDQIQQGIENTETAIDGLVRVVPEGQVVESGNKVRALSNALQVVRTAIGRGFPTKLNSVGKLQPFDPKTGRYLPQSANPGFKATPLGDTITGATLGFTEGYTGVSSGFVPLGRAGALGFEIGKTVGGVVGSPYFGG
jgi:RHS repeat-associated protein